MQFKAEKRIHKMDHFSQLATGSGLAGYLRPVVINKTGQPQDGRVAWLIEQNRKKNTRRRFSGMEKRQRGNERRQADVNRMFDVR